MKSIKNIVLVGMPGCGKTVTGQELARLLSRNLLDTDVLVAQKEGFSAGELIESKGEEYFRDSEEQVVREASHSTCSVIATGGGTVLRPQNIIALKGGSVVFLLERELTALACVGRPLSQSIEKLKELEAKRKPLYEQAADFKVANNTTVEDAAKTVLDIYKTIAD